jgi:hypothetical protein
LLFSGLPIASTGRLTELRNFVVNINSLESHLMDAWLALLTKKVYQSRNHGLSKLIVIQLIVVAFDGLSCDGSHTHVQGRGNDLKETESYSFQMTDFIHQAFIAATSSKPKNRRLLPPSVLFRFLPHLQWPTIDDSLKPR